MVKAMYHVNTVVKHRPASLCDLPCQACELGGVLGAVKKFRTDRGHTRTNTHVRGEAVDVAEINDVKWLLARLPSDEATASAMKRALAGSVSMVDGKGDGLDRQCSGSITAAWLKSQPEEVPNSFAEVLARKIRLPYQLLALRCRECDGTLTSLVLRSDGMEVCDGCRSDLTRAHDRARQNAKRGRRA